MPPFYPPAMENYHSADVSNGVTANLPLFPGVKTLTLRLKFAVIKQILCYSATSSASTAQICIEFLYPSKDYSIKPDFAVLFILYDKSAVKGRLFFIYFSAICDL